MPDDSIHPYDRLLGALDGLPDVVHTRPTTVRTITPLIGNAETWIDQTYRQLGQGDTVFLEAVSAQGSVRLALPPKVAAAIARQRDSLTKQNRRKASKQAAQDRMDRGEAPAFLRAVDTGAAR
jgi:hypothetical protein